MIDCRFPEKRLSLITRKFSPDFFPTIMKSYSLVNQNYLKINKKLTFFQLWIKHVDNARAAEYSLSSKLPNNKDIIHQFCQVPDRSALNFFIVTQSAKFVDIMYTYRKKEPQTSVANFNWQKSFIFLFFFIPITFEGRRNSIFQAFYTH